MGRPLSIVTAALTAACLTAGVAVSAGVTDLLDRPAVKTRRASSSVLLDVKTAGERVVAVGERGIVVLSDDSGKTWRQAKVPTSISLTAVPFPSPKKGFAVGHGGVVLHTEDGGETWARQLDGRTLGKLALEAAQAKAAAKPNDEVARQRVVDAERLVSDGPDKPFLALHFENERAGFIVGAYGLICRTEDGGSTWQPWMDRLDNPKGLHLYAIRVVGKAVYIAGEQGLFFRSLDGGNRFERIPTPYQGTWFAIGVAPSGEITLVGLRGNAFWSADQGKTFAKSAVPAPISFSTVTTLADGTLLFANQAGQLLASRDGGRTLQATALPALPPVASLAQITGDTVMAASVAGAIPIPLAAAKTGGAR